MAHLRRNIRRLARTVWTTGSQREPWSYLGSFGDDFLDENDAEDSA
jgi:hypothetical protein